jgi:hypothetical protein
MYAYLNKQAANVSYYVIYMYFSTREICLLNLRCVFCKIVTLHHLIPVVRTGTRNLKSRSESANTMARNHLRVKPTSPKVCLHLYY